MRSFETLLLCCLAVGSLAVGSLAASSLAASSLAGDSLAASAIRTRRDADGDSAESLPAAFRSTELVDPTEERSAKKLIPPPQMVLTKLLKIVKVKKLLKIAKVAALVLVVSGAIPLGNLSLPTELQELQGIVGDLSEFLVELPANLQLGSRQDTMAREATLTLQDLNNLLDEGAVTAVATLQGEAQGELSFAQTRYADGNRAGNDVTIISGTLSGLKPGVHKLQVTLKGDISSDCDNAGEAYSDESDGIFEANDKGKALVLVRAAKAPLRGTDTILGRSVVITSEADPDKREACGVIVHPGL